MTNDLISRSALLGKAILLSDINGDGWERVLRAVPVEEIEAAEAVDSEPVAHGRWIDNGIPESMLSGCSVCGFSCGAYSFNYCPNCGAKMDEEA